VADSRFHSGHFESIFRRREYRSARQDLLAARGLLTLAGEQIRGLVSGVDDWPSLLPFRTEQLVPGAKYLLIDQETGDYFSVKIGLNSIGRLPNNDIVLEERWVSRRHCALLVHARGGCELHDTASLNGTFVNGQRVRQPIDLCSGDRVQVAKKLLLFIDAKDQPADLKTGDHPNTILV
jgi:hypothetical protein